MHGVAHPVDQVLRGTRVDALARADEHRHRVLRGHHEPPLGAWRLALAEDHRLDEPVVAQRRQPGGQPLHDQRAVTLVELFDRAVAGLTGLLLGRTGVTRRDLGRGPHAVPAAGELGEEILHLPGYLVQRRGRPVDRGDVAELGQLPFQVEQAVEMVAVEQQPWLRVFQQYHDRVATERGGQLVELLHGAVVGRQERADPGLDPAPREAAGDETGGQQSCEGGEDGG